MIQQQLFPEEWNEINGPNDSAKCSNASANTHPHTHMSAHLRAHLLDVSSSATQTLHVHTHSVLTVGEKKIYNVSLCNISKHEAILSLKWLIAPENSD